MTRSTDQGEGETELIFDGLVIELRGLSVYTNDTMTPPDGGVVVASGWRHGLNSDNQILQGLCLTVSLPKYCLPESRILLID